MRAVPPAGSQRLQHPSVGEREACPPVECLLDLEYRQEVDGRLGVGAELERRGTRPDLVDLDVGELPGSQLADSGSASVGGRDRLQVDVRAEAERVELLR